MKKTLLRAALAAAVTFAATAASAALVNGTGMIAAPGVYVGTGVQNGNWSGVNTGGIEVALRAKDRGSYVNIAPVGNLYQVDPGLCTPFCGTGKADWNYEFSVSTMGVGATGVDLLNYIVEIMVDNNPTAGTTFNTLNVFNNWGDNEYWDVTPGSERHGLSPIADERVVQQSVNPLFGNSGFVGFDENQNGLYDIRMNVYGMGQNGTTGQRVLLASTDIQVKVGENVPIPEPASLALAGLGLMGLGLTRRRKVNTST